jgi:2-oxoglutarate ferredoxin oxidoreductase subunit gamma
MISHKLICAGFGGQGVMSLGQLLAYAAMIEDKEVSWMPSYGPEMRGGTAYCCVNISDKPIGSPMITDDASCAIVMNLPSFQKFEPWVVSGGDLLVNSSLINQLSRRNDLHVHYIPANEEAVCCGNVKMANMVMLGAYLELTDIVLKSSILYAFKKVFGKKGRRLLLQNEKALQRGADYIRGQIPLTAAV